MLSNKQIRAIYGENVVISRKASFVLVHLDRPAPRLVQERTREFEPDEFFSSDCPLCQMLKESGVVVFDDSAFEDDGILE